MESLVSSLNSRRRCCMNPGSNHAAVFFTKFSSVHSYGENKPKVSATAGTIHAEDDAIEKLPSLRRMRRLRRIDLLVIRANAGGTVGNSKPCITCIRALALKLPKKGYILDTVHYTDRGGSVISKKFSRLSLESPHIPKLYASVHNRCQS